jgi:DNA-binding transcriptional ArsR family regulator
VRIVATACREVIRFLGKAFRADAFSQDAGQTSGFGTIYSRSYVRRPAEFWSLYEGLTGKHCLTYIGGMVVTPDRESDVFTAISHRARRQMLDLLTEAERSVNDVAAHFEMSRPAVSQHLRILLDAGLVAEKRHGRERRYRLVPARLASVRDWIARYEQFWDHHLHRLQKLLSKKSKQ